MIEPVCENSDVYNRRHGMDVDEEFDRKGPGPHEGCFCDVCFYGTRAAWLAGRKAALDAVPEIVVDALGDAQLADWFWDELTSVVAKYR